jgi:hypothetical protein
VEEDTTIFQRFVFVEALDALRSDLLKASPMISSSSFGMRGSRDIPS